ncbi:MAG TPA: hypothetical protein VK886_14215 [Vicinamibacterales bacterium]|nr:hypothetical protein [Vicinamibacterales bacterium]
MIRSLRFGCALLALGLAIIATPTSTADPRYSEWETPLNLGDVVNSAFQEIGPAISGDGLSLYFGSDRPDGFGNFDLWVSQRPTVNDPWGAPINLGGIVNTTAIDNVPALSRDGHWLFFNSDRLGGLGGIDIWVAWRSHTHDDLAWQSPVNLGSVVNSESFDAGAGYYKDDDLGRAFLFFNSDRPGGPGATDLYVSEVFGDGEFEPPRLIAELSGPACEQRPTVRHDGQELFFFSTRTGGVGQLDLWVSIRTDAAATWAPPVNLGPIVNSVANDSTPCISWDRETLFFSSNRSGAIGGHDLYATTRTKAVRPRVTGG